MHYGDEEGRARVLPTEQPAVEDVETQRGGGTPNEHAVVSDGLRGDGGGGGHERETETQEGRLQHDEECADAQGDEQTAEEEQGGFVVSLTAIGLGGETAGAHAQKVEEGVGDGEEGAADGDGREIVGRAEVAGDGGVDPTEEGDGDVRQDGGDGDAEDGAMLRQGWGGRRGGGGRRSALL